MAKEISKESEEMKHIIIEISVAAILNENQLMASLA